MYFQPLNMTDCLMKTKSPLKMKNFKGKGDDTQNRQMAKSNTTDVKKSASTQMSKCVSKMRHFFNRNNNKLKMCYDRDRDISTLIAGSLLVIACLFAAHRSKQSTSDQQNVPACPSLNLSGGMDR